MTHAIVNGNCPLVDHLTGKFPFAVPVTLEHFRILARLGRNPVRFVSRGMGGCP